MRNKILLIVIIAVSFAIAGGAYAIVRSGSNVANNQVQQQVQTANQAEGSQVQIQTQTQTQIQAQQQLQDGSGTEAQVPNQNQIQNQGETAQVQNREQEGTQSQTVTASAAVEQRKSQVANAVQEMLQVADRNGDIGQQVRVIAQAQNQSQERLEVSLQKVQGRGGVAKFFIGPNYDEINSAKRILQQNREQISRLKQLQNQLANQGDQQQLTQQIQLLEQIHMGMESSLQASEKGFSLLGWMFKLFAK
ncbi:MAG: hypothetical protein WCT16_03500 [Candidatus Buchananbacteria bacterium]